MSNRDRDPDHLHPDIRPLYDQLLAWAASQGINVKPIGIWGDPKAQDTLYALGRTVPGKIVTYDKGSTSKHCFCLLDGTPASKAFDLGIFGKNGLYVQSGNDTRYTALGMEWEDMAREYPDLGLIWGGVWKSLRDVDHFQIS